MTQSCIKGGRLSIQAAMLCKNEHFRLYLDHRSRVKFNRNSPDGTYTEETAKDFILKACYISSRAELDHDQVAAENFKYICQIYNNYRVKYPRSKTDG